MSGTNNVVLYGGREFSIFKRKLSICDFFSILSALRLSQRYHTYCTDNWHPDKNEARIGLVQSEEHKFGF